MALVTFGRPLAAAPEAIHIVDIEGQRHLRLGAHDADDQTVISLTDPEQVPVEYIRLAFLGFALARGVEKVLMIGLGGGAFTTRVRQSLPEIWIDAVEARSDVVDVAKRYFRVREDARFKIHIDDGIAYLERTAGKYDLIFVDVYTGEGLVRQYATPEFFALASTRLASGGVLVLNLAIDESEENVVVSSLAANVRNFACLRAPEDDNLLVFGMAANPPDRDRLAGLAEDVARRLKLPFSLAPAARRLVPGCQTK